MPAHPKLVAHLKTNLDVYGTTSDGVIFRNGKGQPMTYASYGQIWKGAREKVFDPAQIDHHWGSDLTTCARPAYPHG